MRNVISNTSCLIALSNIKRLDLLNKVYGRVFITPEVASEFGEGLPNWVDIKFVEDPTKTKLISASLDLGESSTIALALEMEDALMILDDGKARRFAANMNLTFTGTLGVVVKAVQLDKTLDMKTILMDFQKYGFRIPNDIEKLLLELAGVK